MPVEIKESVIKVTQRESDGEAEEKKDFSKVKEKDEKTFSAPKYADVDIIIDLCTERVLEKLREKYER